MSYLKFNYRKFKKIISLNLEKKENIKLINSQKELLKILAKGNTLKEIAISINCSTDNIKKRTKKLYKKFNVKQRKELIKKAIKLNFLSYKDVSHKFKKRFFKDKVISSPKTIISNDLEPLTENEITILKLAAKGFSKKEIKKELKYYNMHSCNIDVYLLCKKLKAANITNAVFIAIKLGLIEI